MAHVRIFKNKPFARFARRAGLTDADLRGAIDGAERGLVDADLGGGVLKQRIARPGGGKSGGFRAIVLFRAGSRAFFVQASPRASEPTSATTSWPRSKHSRRSCWGTRTRPSPGRWPRAS
jgi:hypothetical protein